MEHKIIKWKKYKYMIERKNKTLPGIKSKVLYHTLSFSLVTLITTRKYKTILHMIYSNMETRMMLIRYVRRWGKLSLEIVTASQEKEKQAFIIFCEYKRDKKHIRHKPGIQWLHIKSLVREHALKHIHTEKLTDKQKHMETGKHMSGDMLTQHERPCK